jgi:hypothetical protein
MRSPDDIQDRRRICCQAIYLLDGQARSIRQLPGSALAIRSLFIYVAPSIVGTLCSAAGVQSLDVDY